MHKSMICFFVLFSLLTLSVQQKKSNRSLEFTMANKKNDTGHWNVNFSIGKVVPSLPPNWKVNLKYNINSFNGKDAFLLEGSFSVPPTKPDDYELFPGIGSYKFYPELTYNFEEAKAICAKEGGHLAIINSEGEANVIRTIYSRYPEGHQWAMLGFHDFVKQGQFTTIFGEPLTSTGYNKWHPNEPDYSGGIVHCGCVDSKGLLGVVGCSRKRPFFCEYDLSWSN